MARWYRYIFPTWPKMEQFLNGAIRGSVDISDGADVDTLTLIIEVHGVDRTVTFAPAKGRDWTWQEILAQIEAAHSDLVGVPTIYQNEELPGYGQGVPIDRRLQLYDSPSVTVRSTGTANAVLGFSAVSDTAQEIIPDSVVQHFERIEDSKDSWMVIIYA